MSSTQFSPSANSHSPHSPSREMELESNGHFVDMYEKGDHSNSENVEMNHSEHTNGSVLEEEYKSVSNTSPSVVGMVSPSSFVSSGVHSGSVGWFGGWSNFNAALENQPTAAAFRL